MSQIIVRGAKTRNLKNITLAIEKNQISGFVGVSGSGKSSLVFSTIAAEAQRQMNDTYPSYVRNRMPQIDIPIVDTIENLSPAIIVNQRALGDNRRSTVGTATDINPTLRLLFSRLGKPFIGYSDSFSFNSPNGMCPICEGLGIKTKFHLRELIDYDKTLNEGAIRFDTFQPGSYRWKRYVDSGLFDNDKKLLDFTKEEMTLFLYSQPIKPPHPLKGWYKSALFEGLIPRITHTFIQNTSKSFKRYAPEIQRVTKQQICGACHGYRLNEKTLSCKINGKHIGNCLEMQLDELLLFLTNLANSDIQLIVKNILQQLNYLCQVGLGYLRLSRETSTLSGGESQRIKLIRSIGSSLSDMMYIFDEPSIGLHPQDITAIGQLINAIQQKGNTVLLIDHDPKIIQLADTIFEIGPKAGIYGGELMSVSSYTDWMNAKKQEQPLQRKIILTSNNTYSIKNINKNNVSDVSVTIPKQQLIVITGVAGSGKTSFAKGMLERYPQDVFYVTQKNSRGNSRSTIVSYLGLFDEIRNLYSKKNHVSASNFSFNGKGACSLCKGKGYIETELAFLDPIRTICEACKGKKYKQDVLNYTYNEKNIAELLALSIEKSLLFFANQPNIVKKIYWLNKIGLSYLTLGQTLNTLSGGEMQRLKLALNLDCKEKLILLDEPTTGLSTTDVQSLLDVFDELLENSNTLVIIEHNTAFIQLADWMIEFGPGSGKKGGKIIYQGKPLAAKTNHASIIGKFL